LKYCDSFKDTLSFTATSQTVYTDWFDISWANELFSFVTFAESGAGNSESITITLQRYSPIVNTGTDIASHGALAIAGSNELVATAKTANAAYGTANKLGMRVRWKGVSSGTWTVAGNTITMTLEMYAKRN